MKSKLTQIFLLVLSFTFVIFLGIKLPLLSMNQTEILWDTWGVPHIYSQDSEGLFQAFGRAQATSHGDLILRLYGQARGKGAQYWGEDYLDSDRYVRTVGIPARAQQWYEQQTPQMQRNLKAFAAGINEYCQEYPEAITTEFKQVLPINSVDILAHIQRVVNFHFVTNPQEVAALGSNGWAIAPSHTNNGNAMLLANPHLPWSDFYLWYEAHLVAADLDAYGVALVGMPGLAIAFNDHLGWTTTVNTFDGADVYDLTLAEGGYVWDGEVQPFTKESQTIKIKQEDGSFESEELTILNSLHGPVVAQQNNKAQALRVVGLDRPYILDQFWAMAKAQNLQQFEAALQSLQLPLFNILYADKAGEIFYLFNAQVPQREQGDWRYWSKTIPGDTAATLWTKYHPYEDLPRLVNPPSGWLQNTNDPPWLATFPQLLNPENYPAYLAPPSLGQAGEIFRTQRSIRMLQENTSMSFEELVALKFSSRLELADRLLDELIPAARELGNELGQEAAEVLAAWDRQVQADSRGAVLFSLWAVAIQQGNFFATPWQASAPLTTPKGLADLQQAVQTLEIVADTMKFLYGSVDVPWGEVVRLTYDKYNLPASGALGILGSFRVLYTVPMPEKGFRTFGGDSYIAAIEFGDEVKAKVLNTYGNATQPNSPHLGDQLPLYLRGELRKAWRDRKEIMVHLERKEVL